ncbi:dTDP-glucose 4,6-dehydratase [Nocardiopsis sp. NPDC058631]|uniref:dTDP-glucose 4,6-dehydratase n=1 Tax=Nocardiopsis sp. NPDC058631 TaxID=3346566 RepID=UPI003663A190
MSTRILVTGGAGFIGSHYVRGLLGPGGPGDVSVVVLDRLTYAGNTANLAAVADDPRLAFVRGDVCDADLVDSLTRDVDQVVHLAAESHVDRSLADGGAFVRTNVLGTQTLLDAALRHGTGPFVYVSTDEVYGSVSAGSSTEDSPLLPSSPYSASKAAGDLVALSYAASHGMDVRVTRCSNNYGPHQYPEKIVPLFVTNLLDGLRVPLYGDGTHVRDWLHVDDHTRGIELVRTRGVPGEVYNIGGGTELSNTDLTALLLDACGAGPEMVERVADRPGHDRRYSVDWTKIRDTLGYRPRYGLAAGIAETVEWYRINRDWWEPLRAASGPVRAEDAAPSTQPLTATL